jgi:hypothetical protein
VISVAHAQIAFGKFASRGPILQDLNPAFYVRRRREVIE